MTYSKENYQKNKKKLMEAQRRYRAKPEVKERYLQKARESSKKWYSNPENRLRRRKYNQASWLRQVKKLEEEAGRVRSKCCEICGNDGKICFDHDHKTGKFRGWICNNCNVVLGKVDDNTKLLESLIKYLEDSVK